MKLAFVAGHDRFVAVIPGLGQSVQWSAISHFFWMVRWHNVEHGVTRVYDQLTASGRNVICGCSKRWLYRRKNNSGVTVVVRLLPSSAEVWLGFQNAQ